MKKNCKLCITRICHELIRWTRIGDSVENVLLLWDFAISNWTCIVYTLVQTWFISTSSLQPPMSKTNDNSEYFRCNHHNIMMTCERVTLKCHSREMGNAFHRTGRVDTRKRVQHSMHSERRKKDLKARRRRLQRFLRANLPTDWRPSLYNISVWRSM